MKQKYHLFWSLTDTIKFLHTIKLAELPHNIAANVKALAGKEDNSITAFT